MPCQQAACRHGSNSAARRGQTGHGSVGTGGAEQERAGPEIGKRASMQLEAYETPSPASTERKPGDAYDNTAADGITECLLMGPMGLIGPIGPMGRAKAPGARTDSSFHLHP